MKDETLKTTRGDFAKLTAVGAAAAATDLSNESSIAKEKKK